MTLIDNGLFAVPYPDLFSKAAYLLESLIGTHAFLDGNKSTAITSSGLFLRIDGYRLTANNQQLETFTLECAQGPVSLEQMALWLESYRRGFPDHYG